VRIVRGPNNHLLFPKIRRKLTVGEIIEQRVLASDLTVVLSTLSLATREEHFQLVLDET
jgi:hypothetical protein